MDSEPPAEKRLRIATVLFAILYLLTACLVVVFFIIHCVSAVSQPAFGVPALTFDAFFVASYAVLGALATTLSLKPDRCLPHRKAISIVFGLLATAILFIDIVNAVVQSTTGVLIDPSAGASGLGVSVDLYIGLFLASQIGALVLVWVCCVPGAVVAWCHVSRELRRGRNRVDG